MSISQLVNCLKYLFRAGKKEERKEKEEKRGKKREGRSAERWEIPFSAPRIFFHSMICFRHLSLSTLSDLLNLFF